MIMRRLLQRSISSPVSGLASARRVPRRRGARLQRATATVGQDVILPCHLKPPFNFLKLTVKWRRNTTAVHTYRSRGDDPDSQDKSFKNRTCLFHGEMFKGSISLKLFNATKRDEGIYTCCVRTQGDLVKRNIALEVENNLSTAAITGIVLGVTAITAIVIGIVFKCN